MKKIFVLCLVLSLMIIFSTAALAADYGPNTVKIPVKWTVEPFFHFFLRINDFGGEQIDCIRYENNERISGEDSWLETFDLGSVEPENRFTGDLVKMLDYEDEKTSFPPEGDREYPTIWFEVSSNDNWKVEFTKPKLENTTQDRWTEPVDLYTYYCGFDATQDTEDLEPGWNSGGWTNRVNSVISGDMGYHLTFFMFGMEYENLKTRYGTYKTTMTYTAYQL
ncbi:MAG: hypothetical protein ACOC21_02685 [Halanaerobiales bacterium]